MQLVFIALLSLLSLEGVLQQEKLLEVRKLFPLAAEDKKTCEDIYEWLENETQDAVLMGYSGAITMIMAKHAINPFSKLSYFFEGKKKLENSIVEKPDNAELRLLRLSTQLHVPSILGYDENIKEDSKFLKKRLPKITSTHVRKAAEKFVIMAEKRNQ